MDWPSGVKAEALFSSDVARNMMDSENLLGRCSINNPSGLKHHLDAKLSDVGSKHPQGVEYVTIDERKGPVHVEDGAIVEPHVHLIGPCLIEANATIRSHAYVREYTWMMGGSLLGHASESKHSLFLLGAKAPHFNYVGDSILGSNVNLGAGSSCRIFATMVNTSVFGLTTFEEKQDCVSSEPFSVMVRNSVAMLSPIRNRSWKIMHGPSQYDRERISCREQRATLRKFMSNLFGTDGIRGRVSLDACDDEGALEHIVDQRLLTPQLMKLLGEALGRCLPEEGEGSQVVIGWDDRPHNATLAAWLTLGFHASNVKSFTSVVFRHRCCIMVARNQLTTWLHDYSKPQSCGRFRHQSVRCTRSKIDAGLRNIGLRNGVFLVAGRS